MKNTLHKMWLLLLTVMAMVSCSMADFGESPSDATEAVYHEYMAIFTVRQSAEGVVYFQVNDSTRLYPRAWDVPFAGVGKMIGQITIHNQQFGNYGYITDVAWWDTVEKGSVVASAGMGDPVDVLTDWMTSAEDGFLTVHYSTRWGARTIGHTLSLVLSGNPFDPYEVRLVHNRNGDAPDEEGDALVCFDLNGLPDTGGKYVDLTLKWLDSEGKDAAAKFKYKTRSDPE